MGATASHYRTHAGAEVDLVIEQAEGRILPVEIKRTLSPMVTPDWSKAWKPSARAGDSS